MRMILIATTGGVGVLLCILAVFEVRVRRTRQAVVPVEIEQHHTSVRILRTEEELGDALRRAARSEQVAAEAYRHRVARYESMLRPLGAAGPRALDEDTEHPLSA